MAKVETLHEFIITIQSLLDTISRSSEVLFRRKFREQLPLAIEEVNSGLWRLLDSLNWMNFERNHSLRGHQLRLKLASFEHSLNSFEEEAYPEQLEEVLEKGSVILQSMAGAIPLIGTGAQELLEFILQEIRRRMRRTKGT